MIRTVRAAGFAAAVLGFAASIFLGAPAQANNFNALTFAAPDRAAEIVRRVAAIADAAVPRPRALEELVEAYGRTGIEDAEQDCLANAVYFEARGEPLKGQLAVAEVVLNRVASSRYPHTICEVVVQPWQFSFVRNRIIPQADRSSQAWLRSVAIARIAQSGAADEVAQDVLWYHADYVSPGWGKRLAFQEKIGLHIFYS
ncbi:MAG: cell wall hydrolase [Pseudomonadota bacterium]|nr:cell wall hydrolase [Pseudomonadota bacterium]